MKLKPRTFRFIFLLLVLFYHLQFYSQKNSVIDSLKAVLEKAPEDTVRVNILNDLGGYLIRKAEYDKALYYLQKALSLAEKLEYTSGILVSYNRTGILYLNRNDYPNSKKYFSLALGIAKKTGDKKGESDIISNIGIIHCDLGEYATALENYMYALKIREQIKDPRSYAASLLSIANIHYLQNNFQKALEFYTSITEIKEARDDKYFYAEVLFNIGLVYEQLTNYPKALSYINSSMQIDEEVGDKKGVALASTNLGVIYSLQKNYTKALELLQKGRDVLIEIGDKRGVAEAYCEMGVIYDSLHQNEKALECFNKQLVLAREIDSKLNIRKAYLFFSNHYQLNNNYKEAYEYYRLYKGMEDSLKSEASDKTIAELEAKYETQKKEKEIEMLKTEQVLKETESTRQKQLLYSAFILAAVIGLTVFLLYNRRQIKKKSELERKNHELERNALSAQMDPHFIFNSLGSISGFISENDKEKAIEYLGVFSRLIRHNLEQSREQLVSVSQEGQMLRSYLHLQQLRYNNKFSFNITIAENIDDSVAIPPMFIQPFVENAILHGIIPKDGPGNITVAFRLDGDHIQCEVLDDGIGKAESQKRKTAFNNMHKSLAMTITEERMAIINSMNKEKIEIEMKDLTDGSGKVCGTSVKLKFPIDHV